MDKLINVANQKEKNLLKMMRPMKRAKNKDKEVAFVSNIEVAKEDAIRGQKEKTRTGASSQFSQI